MKLAENAGNSNGGQHCRKSQNIFTFCHPLQQNLQPHVMLLLKYLTHEEKMSDLINEKLINLVQ